MMDTLRWWWACPRALEGAAADFFRRCNPVGVRLCLMNPEQYPSEFTDFHRRVCATYGLGNNRVDRMTRLDVWSVGWNRRLLLDCGAPAEPGTAAVRILKRVRQLADSIPVE